jgi:acyl-CoA reductase-like NAD-dependent aldehyde dehydrogenase
MTATRQRQARIQHPDRFFIGGEWVEPSSDSTIDVIDSASELPFLTVAAAQAADMDRAITAAKQAFDTGPWPRMTHAERAEYMRAIGAGISEFIAELADMWTRETGVVHSKTHASLPRFIAPFEYYADLADTYAFEEPAQPTEGGEFGLLVREPVGVVGSIIPWNGAVASVVMKTAPALLAGCTVILKSAPEAPGPAYLVAEVAEKVGLPPGVFNVVTADREVSELLVRDPRVDKIAFTGSTAAGRRIGSICGERIARCTLELGGKSAAVILDDADLEDAAATLAGAECFLSGQVCSSLTRIIVSRNRHDELVEALGASFGAVRVGDPFEAETEMGPLAAERQRDRVEGYIAHGKQEGATLVTGGGRPKHLERGWYVEPTVFGNVQNSYKIAQEEIFGPVVSVIPAADEEDAVRIANDTIYGLNASVFTPDVDRARAVAARLRTGTVGHNAFRSDFGIAFGGFKQSGIGREGGREGLASYLETKTVILEEVPAKYRS